MKCPVCPETDLVMSERQGVEIDYCPKCRGVWLDRGELDKIVERSVVMPAPSTAPSHATVGQVGQHRQHDHHYDDDHHHGHKRRKSWLGEMFD